VVIAAGTQSGTSLAWDRESNMTPKKAPQRIGDVVAQLLSRRGYGRELAPVIEDQAWRDAVGDALAEHTRPGRTRRGVLEVTVRNSTVMQELVFQKTELIQTLIDRLPDAEISDLRFRVGVVD
jgi:predicted nucleic acid-binding Zn ribbon protein